MNGHTQVWFFDGGRFAVLREGGEGTEQDPYRQRIVNSDYISLAEAASLTCQGKKGKDGIISNRLPEHCPCLACSITAAKQRYHRNIEDMEKIRALLPMFFSFDALEKWINDKKEK